LLALVFRQAPYRELLLPMAGVAVAIILRAVLEQARTMLAHRTAARVQETLRGRLYDKIVGLGPKLVRRRAHRRHDAVDGRRRRATADFFGQYLPQLLISACAPFAIFAFMAWWDCRLRASCSPRRIVRIGIAVAGASTESARGDCAAAGIQSVREEFLDAMQGLPTLKAFGQGPAYGRMLAVKARALSDGTFWVLAVSILTRGITDLGMALGAALALALGAYRVTQG
jgi:ATP-binding cassette subfamily C protein CydCD